MIRGFAYQALGQADSAIASFELFLSLADPQPEMDGVFRAQVLQRLGELYEGKGDKAKAIDYYSQFTEQWADADATLQPRVREIRDRVVKLQRDIG